MYYPIGLPKRMNITHACDGQIVQVVCNRDRILYAILCQNGIWIWLSRPCVPLTAFRRTQASLDEYGVNCFVEWRPDSSMLVVTTSKNILFFYSVSMDNNSKEVYEQDDSPLPGLRRHSAELYTKERILPLTIAQICSLSLSGNITSLVCLRDELMVATSSGLVQRVRWDGTINSDYSIDLSRIPFCDDQLVLKAIPLNCADAHIVHLEYSPLVGGFAVVINDGRAAFLTASTLKFDPNAVQGIWAKELDDVTCAAINHKYRLLAFGRKNSEGVVLMVDEATGGLELCHRLALSSKDFPGIPGPVGQMRWTPDGTVLAMCWSSGGFSLWSVFGSLLTASLKWDHSEHNLSKPITIKHLEWGAEGYEAWCVESIAQYEEGETEKSKDNSVLLPPFKPDTATKINKGSGGSKSHYSCGKSPQAYLATEQGELVNMSTFVVQISFIKSALTVNPCMSRLERVLLQGSDRLYLSTREGVDNDLLSTNYLFAEDDDEESAFEDFGPKLRQPPLNVAACKQWLVVPIPYTYTAANWPIRYTCLDDSGEHLGVAGRNGVAHYSLRMRKWHLFGNECQEEDLVVTGGLLWWKSDYLVLGAYSIPQNADQVRLYPRNQKLDDQFVTTVTQSAQVLLLNIYWDQMIVLTADCRITVFNLKEIPSIGKAPMYVNVSRIQEVDISGLTVHPACVISLALTSLRTESWRSHSAYPIQPAAQSIIFNISGKVLMIQRDHSASTGTSLSEMANTKMFQSAQMTPIVLASCCESVWCAARPVQHKPHLSHALWLHCGSHGTRAWLPLFPAPGSDRGHAFMARRIMLPFTPSIYPLAVLFEEAIMIGAETDSSITTCDATSMYQPTAVIERTSQVYLHHLLRQLLRRNLGYHAWEVANTCRNLPYFPHALELLLHQVLEEEATSKDPIPDSLLPRVLDFIREFPVHLLTIVQCARKTELALWRYLFAVAGSPRHLFSRALEQGQLETAASYLIILQNLESSMISRTYATQLLAATLEAAKWDLSKDLIRFLRSIDPSDLESPKPNVSVNGGTRIGFTNATSPVSPQCADEDLSMIMPNTQALRGRSFSVASAAQKITLSSDGCHNSISKTSSDSKYNKNSKSNTPPDFRRISSGSSKDFNSADEYFLDVILQRHAKKLLLDMRLSDLGRMCAHLDFPLVAWLRRERLRAAANDEFVSTLRRVHKDFSWPFPSDPTSLQGNRNSLSSDNQIAMEDHMHHLAISVGPKISSLSGGEVGDSGYLSQSNTGDTGGTPLTPQHAVPSHLRNNLILQTEERVPQQAVLIPHNRVPDMLSVMSEECSLYGEDSVTCGNAWSPNGNDPTRHLLLRPPDPPPQAHPKPPPHSEVQLRYLLQLFLEAGCLELSCILAIVLRDALAILRVISLARANDTPSAVIYRLIAGMKEIMAFTQTQCLGYSSFMTAVMGQAKVLQRFADMKESSTRESPPSIPSNPTSNNSPTSSVVLTTTNIKPMPNVLPNQKNSDGRKSSSDGRSRVVDDGLINVDGNAVHSNTVSREETSEDEIDKCLPLHKLEVVKLEEEGSGMCVIV